MRQRSARVPPWAGTAAGSDRPVPRQATEVSNEVAEAGIVMHQENPSSSSPTTRNVCGTPRGMETQCPAPTTSSSSHNAPPFGRQGCTRCRPGLRECAAEARTGRQGHLEHHGVHSGGARCSTTKVSRNHHACACSFSGESTTAVVTSTTSCSEHFPFRSSGTLTIYIVW